MSGFLFLVTFALALADIYIGGSESPLFWLCSGLMFWVWYLDCAAAEKEFYKQ